MKHTVWERIRRPFLIGLGFFFVGLGGIGVVMPLLPTTPFLILASLLFSKSSPRFKRWLLKTRFFGHYLRHYENGTSVPKSIKIKTIIFLWVGIGSSLFIVDVTWARIVLPIIGMAVSTHIITIKPKNKTKSET